MRGIGEGYMVSFYRLISDGREAGRADRSADGMLATEALRYCEALASAWAFGLYIYPPLNFSLIWDGTEIAWTYEGADGWYPLRGAQYPGFRQMFEETAPDSVKSFAPPCIVATRDPDVVQIAGGYLPRTPRPRRIR